MITFRAAAIDQLQVWADRVGAPLIRDEHGADPGGCRLRCGGGRQSAQRRHPDNRLGRQRDTKINLMEELRKVKKIISRQLPGAPDETLLAPDATTGQNGLQQAKVFTEVAEVTDMAVAKRDGTAKGGIVFAIARELKLLIRYVGTGEKITTWPSLMLASS